MWSTYPGTGGQQVDSEHSFWKTCERYNISGHMNCSWTAGSEDFQKIKDKWTMQVDHTKLWYLY